MLVASSPADGDDNVVADVTPRLRFSEPVTFGAGAILVQQEDPARALAFTATLSDDALAIDLTLEQAPELPATLSIELDEGITDLAGNPLAPTTVRVQLPVWRRLGGAVNRQASASASDVRVALDDQGRAVLLAVEDGGVYVSRWELDSWHPLGGALNQQPALASAGAEARAALMIDANDEPIAAFRETSGVVVMRWDGSEWQLLGDEADPEGGGSYAPALTRGPNGQPILAFDALTSSAQPVLRLRTLVGARWQTMEDVAVEARGVRLASSEQGSLVLAYRDAAGAVIAKRWDGAGIAPLGAGAAIAASSSESFALSVDAAATCMLSAQGQGTLRWDGSAWQRLSRDLGFADSSAAVDREIAHALDGAVLGAFAERPPGEAAMRVYAQRLDGTRFQPLGPALNRDRSAHASRPSLALDQGGRPLVAFLEIPAAGGPARVFASVFNADPARPPLGLRTRGHTPSCLATAPLDGSRLVETGCFADAATRVPAAGFIPFDVSSPLWSDGAFKRRFFMLPEGKTVTYRDPGIWTFPAGTILIKEFSIEGRRGDASSLRPVETRFLVVRDSGDWDRYSYQWNQQATDAVLRPAAPPTPLVDFAIETETGTSAMQTHLFPSRAMCLSCHQTPGTVLGPQTAMLDRNFDYGPTVDNQLHAMQQLGIFGATLAPTDPQPSRFMPNPADTTYSTEARLRSYLHANCSGCHHPLEALDLRIEVATLDTGLCDKIDKGNLDGSTLYWRDVQRGYPGQPGVAPMPPLGTLTPNPLLEPLIDGWILDPQNPCP